MNELIGEMVSERERPFENRQPLKDQKLRQKYLIELGNPTVTGCKMIISGETLVLSCKKCQKWAGQWLVSQSSSSHVAKQNDHAMPHELEWSVVNSDGKISKLVSRTPKRLAHHT